MKRARSRARAGATPPLVQAADTKHDLQLLTEPSGRPQAADGTGGRWLALSLPAFSIQLFERALQQPMPLAVSEQERIIACNAAAQAFGVRLGMPEGAARALADRLRIVPRRPAAERAALERLAVWAMQFSDLVSLELDLEQALERPAALVLETRRSLRLFGGAERLRQQVVDAAVRLGWQVHVVMAPTPGAALLLAAAGQDGLVCSFTKLRGALGPLPLACLVHERRAREDLAAMGVRTLEELLRLPRTGLAERFGLTLLQRIERLLGERLDPRAAFQPPERFEAELELPAEVAETNGLVFACRRLLDECGAFLTVRQSAVQRLRWQFVHANEQVTSIELGSARLLREPTAWLELLRERLVRVELADPVRGIRLRSERLHPMRPSTPSLPGLMHIGGKTAPDKGADAGAALLDRLHARLGEAAVRGMRLEADHRPERAWRWVSLLEERQRAPQRAAREPAASNGPEQLSRSRKSLDQLDAPSVPGLVAQAERPLWLLPEPVLLPQSGRRPWLNGPLELRAGCERIDTGWWDGHEVARDYFIARTAQGERLWVFREMHGERRWFLHGLLGIARDLDAFAGWASCFRASPPP